MGAVAVLEFWVQVLTEQNLWHRDKTVLYLLDHLSRAAFLHQHEECLQKILYQQHKVRHRPVAASSLSLLPTYSMTDKRKRRNLYNYVSVEPVIPGVSCSVFKWEATFLITTDDCIFSTLFSTMFSFCILCTMLLSLLSARADYKLMQEWVCSK